MSLDENKALVRRAVEAFDAVDPDPFEEVFSPQLAQEWRQVLSALPFGEHHIEITAMVAEGDMVAVKLASRGGHTGTWEGVPPTGKSWTNRGMGMARIEGGRIVEFDTISDELGHLKQLGATITPPAPSG